MKIVDKLLLSGYSGGLAAIAANCFLYLLNLIIPGNNINMPELTAEFFLDIDPKNISLITRILGFIWSMSVGGIYSLFFITALELTTWDKYILKSIIIVTGSWLFFAGVIMKLMKLADYVRDEPLSIAGFFAAHIFFAIIMGFLVKRNSSS